MTKAFPKMSKLSPVRTSITDATLKDFSGGLKSADNTVVLQSKYSVALTNIVTDEETSHRLRFGTKLLTTTAAEIIDIVYFVDRLIVCLVDGRIQAINSTGVVTTIWSTTIAAALPGSPTGWSVGLTHIDSTEMNGQLIIFNDVDKPVTISPTYVVTYLQDLAVLTNVNTPIARHVTTVEKYCVCATRDKPEIIISSSGAAGVWPGDAAPNDSIIFNLSSFAPKNNKQIIALYPFRNRLFVYFVTSIVIIELGIYNATGQHTPKVLDSIFSIGTISHRTLLTTDIDTIVYSTEGVNKIKRNTAALLFDSKELSGDIAPLLYKNFPQLDNNSEYSFHVRDMTKNKIFFFIKTQNDEMLIVCLNHDKEFRKISWSLFAGWDFAGGCSSELKRTYFYKGNKVYQYGNDTYADEAYTMDYIGDTSFNLGAGVPIEFNWESPWLDANARLVTKQLLNITGDSLGEADFNLDLYTDKAYKDSEGNYDPAASMTLRAGSVGGYGSPSEGFGGGRRFSDERFFGFPVKFKTFKFRVYGSAVKALTISSISFIYRMGGYKR